MKIDNLYTRALVHELQFLDEGARIEKVHQPTQYEVILNLRTKQGNKRLLLSIHPETFRFHFTTRAFENPREPKQFCLALRKHIESGRITAIEQIGNDRHIKITVDTYDVVGNPVKRYVYLELMGRHSNLILVDENNKIIDALKRLDVTQNEYREILPHAEYVLPQQNTGDEKRDSSFYVQPPLQKWIAAHEYETNVLALRAMDPRGVYYRFLDTNKVWLGFMEVDEVFDGERFEKIVFPTLSEALDLFYYDRMQRQQLKEKVTSLLQFVQKTDKRNRKKLKNLANDLAKAEDYDKYQEYGNLLLAHQGQLNDHVKSVEVVNYFSPEQEKVTIPMDEKSTVAQNAQKYFKRYTKSKTAIVKVQEQIEATEEEIAYFETIFQALDQADLETAEQIRTELVEGGYLKQRRQKIRGQKKPQFTTFMFDDTKILVGKNNLQNDQITMKERRKDYIWLHIKDFPGSHVLVCSKEPNEETIHAAGMLAAYFSKLRMSENVAVDYTQVQHVSKPTGAKPGYVIYVKQKTMFVTPTVSALQELFPEDIF